MPSFAFQHYQHQFVRHLRDPSGTPSPDPEAPARTGVYTRLLYGKIEASLLACFPLTQALLGERHWSRLVREFIAHHRCVSPFYRQIPDEFVAYLHHERAEAADPPFLNELVHYEWLELVLQVADDAPARRPVDRGGDLLTGPPVLTQVLHVHAYHWPVHTISADLSDWRLWRDWKQAAMRTTTTPSYILGFRDCNDDVRRVEINAVSARLIELLQNGRGTGREVLLYLADELSFQDIGSFIQFGEQLLNRLRDQGAILGISYGSNRPAPRSTQ